MSKKGKKALLRLQLSRLRLFHVPQFSNMSKLTLVFFLSVALSNASARTDSDLPSRVVGGSFASANEYPWFTMLDLGGPFCGGSLVSPEWVLTAAHCITGSFRASGTLRVGAFSSPYTSGNNGGQPVEFFEIKQFVDHPDYDDPSSDNDYSLLRLDGTSTITPVALDSSNLSDSYSNGKVLVQYYYYCLFA